jgi:PAS domain S-box-containing protein
MRGVFSSLRARVLLLIAAPFVVMLSMTLYHTLEDREVQIANAKTRVLDVARAMAGEQQRIIEHVHQVLSALARLHEIGPGVASDACNQALSERLRQEPNFNAIRVARADGEEICDAPLDAERPNLADRDYFKTAIEARKFTISDYIISRTSGKPSIGFAYPMLNAAGVPRLVIVATVNLSWLEEQLIKAQLPAGARAVVADADGRILARYPDPEAWVGKTAPKLQLLNRVLAEGGEGTEEDIDIDGVRRIFGFVPLQQTDSGQAHLWVAVPTSVVVGPSEHAFVMSLMLGLGVIVLTFGAVWVGSESLFVRPISALTDAAQQLGRGNLATRAGFEPNGDEIGKLAQSFDRMAEGLQTKTEQLSRAVRALRVLSAGNRTLVYAKQGEQHLLGDMCRAIGEAGDYSLVWVGYAENDADKSIRPAAHWKKTGEAQFGGVKLSWGDAESAGAPPGRAIRTGTPVVVQDIRREPGPGPWRDYALNCGCGSCIALPVRIDNHVIGVLNICAEEAGAFSAEEIRLLSESAADLSFGIASQRAELERARMQRALTRAEDRYQAAAEANLDALFIAKCVRDEAGQITDFECTEVNSHAADLLGAERATIVGRQLCELLPIKGANGLFGKYVQVVATGAPFEEEFQLDTGSTKAKWLRHQVVRVGDGIAIFARDITESKQAAIRLKESEERLSLATAAGQMGAWSRDLKNDTFAWSDGIGPVFGLPPGEGLRTPAALLEAVHPADRDMVARVLAEGRENGAAPKAEFRILWPDGTLHWVETQSEYFRDAKGVPERGVGVAMDVTARKSAELDLKRANRALRTLSKCNEALIHATNEPELLASICRLIVESGGYQMAWVGFAEQDAAKTVRPVAQSGHDDGFLVESKFSWADTELGRGPTGTAIRTGSVQVNQDFLANPALEPWRKAALKRGYQSSIALPLRNTAGAFGALTIDASEAQAFNETEADLLLELADDLAFGIETLRTRAQRDRMIYMHEHHEEMLRKSLEESIKAISDTLEMRDPYTAGHQSRVATLAVAIAGEMGLAADDIHGIELAAGIHDLGKIRVPAEILSKPGKLSEVEFMLIKGHPEAGYDILKGIEFPWPIADMVRQHHERIDGSGYPQGLKADQLLQGSKIMAVADVVEAMASHRPYRAALGVEAALAEIKRGRGTAFEPAVVDACVKLFDEQRFAFQF